MQHTPITGQYREPSEHNGAAILSIVCAILWPLATAAMFLIVGVANVAGPGATATPPPEPAYSLLDFAFLILPIMGFIAGAIGLYRAVKQPLLRNSRWWAVTGLALGILWCIVAYVIIG